MVFFALGCLRTGLKTKNLGLKSIIWIVPYLSGLVLMSYLGAFGGKNIIPFGWDFLVIAIFSGIILKLALLCRSNILVEEFKLALNLAPTFIGG